jgi:hypothetical protein
MRMQSSQSKIKSRAKNDANKASAKQKTARQRSAEQQLAQNFDDAPKPRGGKRKK